MPSQIDFWFSIGSTYTYLSVMRIDEVARRAGVNFTWRPFDVRAIMVEMNNIPFHTTPVKLRYMWRDVERRATLYGIPWSAVPPYPIKHLSLVNGIALLATEEGWCADYVKAAYRVWFGGGKDPTVEPSLSDNLRAIGQNPEKVIARAASEEGQRALEDATSAARALGIFGSPTFVTNGEIFWGDDRLEDALRWHEPASEPLAVLVTRKMPDGTFAAIDALQNLRVVQRGFTNVHEAEKFIEEFYVARGVLRPRESKQ